MSAELSGFARNLDVSVIFNSTSPQTVWALTLRSDIRHDGDAKGDRGVSHQVITYFSSKCTFAVGKLRRGASSSVLESR